jgi:hypothetical protein
VGDRASQLPSRVRSKNPFGLGQVSYGHAPDYCIGLDRNIPTRGYIVRGTGILTMLAARCAVDGRDAVRRQNTGARVSRATVSA